MIEMLTGKEHGPEFRLWSSWVATAAKMRRGWIRSAPTDDPFAYNETASLSFLACAAGRAGFLALADYCTPKRHSSNGRCDFWLAAERYEWVFEFKQAAPWGTPEQSRAWVASQWQSARSAAGQLIEQAGVRSFAGLVVTSYWVDGRTRGRHDRLVREFLEANATFAWKLSPIAPGRPTVFIAFGTSALPQIG
jgi:hypothetical protein